MFHGGIMKLINVEQTENIFTITNLSNGFVSIEVREKSPTNTMIKWGGGLRKLGDKSTFQFKPAQYQVRKGKPLYIKATFNGEIETSQITIQ
jgi:hypothetical protein